VTSATDYDLGLDTGARFVGTTFQTVPALWTLTATRTYTYEYAWDEASTGWSVSYVAQRPPAPAFDVISIDEGSNKDWDLQFPPRYRNQTSIADVEAQSCSAWNDTANNKVYIHLCDSEAPTADHNVYFVRSGYGSITVTGDYIRLTDLQFEHGASSGYGLKIDATSDGYEDDGIYMRAASYLMQGTNADSNGLNSRAVAIQGIWSDAGCAATGGRGACWTTNAGNGGGQAVGIGVSASSASSGNVMRNADVRNFWNGMDLYGPNRVEDSIFWGSSNHNFALGPGTGTEVLRVIVDNGQEGVHFNADALNWSITYSIFPRAVVLGNNIGPTTTPVGGTFTHNILSKINANDAVADTGGMTSDCNLFIPNYGGLDTADIYEWGHTASQNWNTLALIRTNTPHEDNSVHLADDAYWSQIFATYTAPDTWSPDYRPVSSSAQQINMGATCGYAGPYSSYTGGGASHSRRLRFRRPGE
jgi:hypothetical protein